MTNVRLSVIIPCYNQGKYLSDTLACFSNYHEQQTYEIIIINDGSTDEHTKDVLVSMEQNGYQVLHQENQGLCSARNNGIRQARGEYILPLDGDDKIDERFIAEAIAILDNNPNYAVVYCDAKFFEGRDDLWEIGEFNLQRLMLWNCFHASGVYRKSAWEKVNGYDPNLNYLGFEDWDFWLSLAFSGHKFYYLKKTYFFYRIRKDSMVRNFTTDTYRVMQEYIEQKHHSYIGKKYLNNQLAMFLKRSKKLWFKLFLRVYFPGFLEKMVKKGKIDSTNVFH